MPPHIKTILIFIGSLAFVIWLLVYINNRDNKKKKPVDNNN